MADIIHLAPHDAMPDGPGRHLVVIRRFEEDRPGEATTEIILTGKPEQVSHPRQADGSPMPLPEAVTAALQVAEQEGLDRVFVLDRLAGDRERDIIDHAGDHSVHMDQLEDTDSEDGEPGPDMRDVMHPRAPAGP